MARTYNEQWQDIADGYLAEIGHDRATASEIASWAIDQGLWRPSPQLVLNKAAEDVARALREDYVTDSQGRSVRAKHAVRVVEEGVQHTFWADLRHAPPLHVEMALKQRRHQIVADCLQLKTDMDSYNQNYNAGRQLTMDFDFTLDLRELDAA